MSVVSQWTDVGYSESLSDKVAPLPGEWATVSAVTD